MSKKKKQKEDKPRYFYSIIPDALQDDMALSIQSKYFWSIVYRWCNNKKSDHPSTMKSLDFFAEQLTVDKRTIQRWKNELKDSGWLKEKRRYNNSSVIIISKFKETDNEQNTRGSHDTDVTSTSNPFDEILTNEP